MSRYDNIDLINREMEQCKVALQEADNLGLLTNNGKRLMLTFDLPVVERMYPPAKVQLIQKTAQYLEYILCDEKNYDITIQQKLDQVIDVTEMKSKNFQLFSERLKTRLAGTSLITWGDLLALPYEKVKNKHLLGGRSLGAMSFSLLNTIVFEKTGYKIDEHHDLAKYLDKRESLS